ncbi:NmrA family NAD(P)-binding protein [Streptomyces sp. NPDC017991]|uniref:NmrA family NAD(P)-binding protein n=1 Tax=Streptomyces sp. NPDC017991 TaxID=3365026 RepID=UPI0037965C4E
MTDKKIIAIAGATGSQGGGLARAILADPENEFSVRALTREVDSVAAKDLERQGAELVKVDLESQDEISQAFEGAYGAYCVTFYWQHLSAEKETVHAANLAAGAQAAGVKHVIWSTLEDSRALIPLGSGRMPVLDGRYNVPHADVKAESNKLFSRLGVPTTFLQTSFYWENFINLNLGPQRAQDGKLWFTLPIGDAVLSGISSKDIGKCALGIFKRGPEMVGETVSIAGEHLSGAEMAAELAAALGEQVLYSPLKPADFREFGFPGANDLANMFQYQADCSDALVEARDIEISRSLNPELQDFSTWLKHNKALIPLG